MRLLPDYPMETRPWNLVFPSRHLQSPSVNRFIDTALEVYRGEYPSPAGE